MHAIARLSIAVGIVAGAAGAQACYLDRTAQNTWHEVFACAERGIQDTYGLVELLQRREPNTPQAATMLLKLLPHLPERLDAYHGLQQRALAHYPGGFDQATALGTLDDLFMARRANTRCAQHTADLRADYLLVQAITRPKGGP